jgi:hypothetical protein
LVHSFVLSDPGTLDRWCVHESADEWDTGPADLCRTGLALPMGADINYSADEAGDEEGLTLTNLVRFTFSGW